MGMSITITDIMLPTRLFVLVIALFAAVPAGAEVLLAQNRDSGTEGRPPAPGTLVLPGQDSGKEANNRKEKCMTVCARWGEECTLINRGAGGTTRKCRRTCKQFTEECF